MDPKSDPEFHLKGSELFLVVKILISWTWNIQCSFYLDRLGLVCSFEGDFRYLFKKSCRCLLAFSHFYTEMFRNTYLELQTIFNLLKEYKNNGNSTSTNEKQHN
jgi:hypothetical protein